MATSILNGVSPSTARSTTKSTSSSRATSSTIITNVPYHPSPISSFSSTQVSTRSSPALPSSAEAIDAHDGSGDPSIAVVVALAVVFSFLGVGLLLALFCYARRRRREMRRKTKGPPKIVFRYHAETTTHPSEATHHSCDRQGDLRGWINTRIEENENTSSTVASPTTPEPKSYSRPPSSGPNVPHKSPLPTAMQSMYHDGQWHDSASHVEAIPIPYQCPPMLWKPLSSKQERMHGLPYHERTSSELFYAAPHGNAPGHLESSPTPSSMCIHESTHSHEEPRGFKIGNVPTNLPLVYFPQEHEGHLSARASMHSGNTNIHSLRGGQRTRTSSLPMARSHLRKARSVDNMGVTKKPVRRPSRKEVPKYVLDESGFPIDAPPNHLTPQPHSRSVPFGRPKHHSKSRSVSMHTAPSVPPK